MSPTDSGEFFPKSSNDVSKVREAEYSYCSNIRSAQIDAQCRYDDVEISKDEEGGFEGTFDICTAEFGSSTDHSRSRQNAVGVGKDGQCCLRLSLEEMDPVDLNYAMFSGTIAELGD